MEEKGRERKGEGRRARKGVRGKGVGFINSKGHRLNISHHHNFVVDSCGMSFLRLMLSYLIYVVFLLHFFSLSLCLSLFLFVEYIFFFYSFITCCCDSY